MAAHRPLARVLGIRRLQVRTVAPSLYRPSSVLLFAGLALLSAVVSAASHEWTAGAAIRLVPGIELKPIWPGIAFGAALSIAARMATGATFARLVACFLVVQLAWQLAVTTAVSLHEHLDWGGGITVRGLSTFDGRMLVPGLAAGGLGGLGTWLGATIAMPCLRHGRLACLVVLVGTAAGAVLALNNAYLLYGLWQCAVAMFLGRGVAAARP